MISDLIQRASWPELYENCGTSDMELAKSAANIFSMFESAHVWKFVDYVASLPADKRRERRDSTLVVCLTIGRIGQSDPKKGIRALQILLADDHMLRQAVEASLANLWVYDHKTTERELFDKWIIDNRENDDLQEIAVLSSDYLLTQEPEYVTSFLRKVLRLDSRYKSAYQAAKFLIMKHGFERKIQARRPYARVSSTVKSHSKTRRKRGSRLAKSRMKAKKHQSKGKKSKKSKGYRSKRGKKRSRR
jgi:hypothetical protein